MDINQIKQILINKGALNFLPDKKFLEVVYEFRMNKKLNLENPKTFNEKLQWLKLYDRNPEYTKMVDKYEVKKYVSEIIGEEHIIPTIGVYDKFDEINFGELPRQFVMKCTHDSGSTIVCKDKSELDIKRTKTIINKRLKNNYFYSCREWAYKNVFPRILVEDYIGENLTDYRIYCFNGEPKYIYMYISKNEDITKPEPETCNIYDTNWNLQNFKQKSPQSKIEYKKPEKLDEMIEMAKKLSYGIKFLRVDFYIVNNNVLFGELTFFPGGGFSKFYPNDADLKLGNLLNIKG